jgi:DNA-binding NtrC family response regulator
MQQRVTLLSRVADSDATVLITGASGVGKELRKRNKRVSLPPCPEYL